MQEIVARAKTSLRAFYQHFSSKDDLLLALFDRTMAQSAQAWRTETTGMDASAALKLVIDRISAQPESSTQDSLNRALTLYNQQLAETRPATTPAFSRRCTNSSATSSTAASSKEYFGPASTWEPHRPSSCRPCWARFGCTGWAPN
ncbi:bacterial regulatory s, tetR family protein [Mycobacterium xenopi 3993]|nr:bacterial regulatory s, tetR family protein [Mycobacterium xenopi 3993]